MKHSKKKFMVPFIVFLLGICVLGAIVYGMESSLRRQNNTKAELNAMTYAERMRTDIMEGIGITRALQQIVISENGKLDQFDKVAENMMADYIQSIQIAPEGVVTEIYPEQGNATGKIDLLHDKDRGEISQYARDHHTLVLQGPFQLKQGGYGIAIRNPVYLEDESGQERFWGFTIAIIRVPDIFADSVNALSNFGYEYRLSKTVSPWESTYEEVYSSSGEMADPVSYSFEIGGEEWKLEVMPKSGWVNSQYFIVVIAGGALIVLLLTGLTGALMVLEENRNNFRRLAVTDSLTGIYNRQGFDELVEQYMRQNPTKHCIVAQTDVDDFKMINDIYGHAAGDKALQSLAKSMQSFFKKDAVLGRNGGDEFCMFLPDCSYEDAKELMQQFTKYPKTFSYKNEEHTFSISLGYAEYPVCASDRAQLIRCADVALYEVKLRGKNGCMAYRDGHQMEIRKQLGFALKDISENLPGAFIIYKADKTDDEIFFANHELIRLTGCKSMKEMLAYTKSSFRNLIREDEQEKIEKSIWEQIEDGHSNDYIHFHMRKADGTILPVLDHGRIVDSSRYGRVFYVLIMDWNSMQRHYSDKVQFSEK